MSGGLSLSACCCCGSPHHPFPSHSAHHVLVRIPSCNPNNLHPNLLPLSNQERSQKVFQPSRCRPPPVSFPLLSFRTPNPLLFLRTGTTLMQKTGQVDRTVDTEFDNEVAKYRMSVVLLLFPSLFLLAASVVGDVLADPLMRCSAWRRS